MRELQSLTVGRTDQRVYITKTNTIQSRDVFSVNKNDSDDLGKVNIQTASYNEKADSDERETHARTFYEERRIKTEAVIMRIMKSEQIIAQRAQYQAYQVTEGEFYTKRKGYKKKFIEAIIDRKCLKRVP